MRILMVKLVLLFYEREIKSRMLFFGMGVYIDREGGRLFREKI